ncbi:MAG TPA: ABC transporter permease [Candidatus Sulfotelmatobacter sp.]|nr:ABC transporter permease [Candidatus Sulfotelmatobacter sp.]
MTPPATPPSRPARRLPWASLVPSVGYPALIFVVLVAGWEAGARAGLFPRYLLPAPSDVLARCLTTADLMGWHALMTCDEIVVGFVLAASVGVLLAAVIVFVRPFEQAIYPWLVVVQVVPKVAIGPLLVVWLGIGFLPKIVISFLLAFFPVLISTMVGLRSVQQDSVFLLRSMGAGPLKCFVYLQLPNALPQIFGSLKVAITLAIVGALVGEFVGADHGLGYVLVVSTGTLDTVLMFVAFVWITGVSLLLYALVAVVEKLCVSWHVSQRSGPLTRLF